MDIKLQNAYVKVVLDNFMEVVKQNLLFQAQLEIMKAELVDKDTLQRIFNTAKRLKLPVFHKDFTDYYLLSKSLSDTMKHRNGNQYLPVPIDIGNYKIVNDVMDVEIKLAIELFKKYGNE